ncbi:carboxylesterase family protein [Streptomyces sp. ET3-23]|uniref:carboxylesterase/lipase family protein n=1 Tax=Streptomyces sp. ET3-23 TaxID=2885643 RepID=UPI001D10FA1B|nr:carboxylesterase family protein [Streptomyces sp. ET3-23]MCC2275856.1 carboxylesterase family protein [Streptomyces sp. ET3-23]
MFPRDSRLRGRAAVALAALALGAVTCLPGGASAQAGDAENCRAATSQGPVQGMVRGGTCAYLGVPYAAAPTGPRRFRPPEPPAARRGTLNADVAKPPCPQDLADGNGQGDEDCLHVNIWAPRTRGAHRPVMVFLHGGENVINSASDAMTDGAALAARGDAVVVSADYRLGILGWTELGSLDSSYAGSGNNGLRDEAAALGWVREQAAAFGGDPRNVTVFGQSAGSVSINALLAGEHPERLFRRAVTESGPGYLVHTRHSAESAAQRVFTAGGIHRVGDLAALDTRQILELQRTARAAAPGLAGAVFFGPYVDGSLVPGQVLDRVAAGSARNVDVMTGSNSNETDFWALFQPGILELPLSAYAVFPAPLAARKQQMYDVYAADRPGLAEGRVVNAMLTDQIWRIPSVRLAQAQSRWRPSYVYQFDWHVPYAKGVPDAQNLGAMHQLELPFVFGTLDLGWVPRGKETLAARRPELTRLSQAMMDAWTSFARTGRPGWRAYQGTDRATRFWDVHPVVRSAPRDNERALWDGYEFPSWNS